MLCSICFDGINLSEVEGTINCEKHEFHTECYYIWISVNKAVEGSNIICPVCCRQIGDIGLKKIGEFSQNHLHRLIDFSRRDNTFLIQRDFIEGRRVSKQTYLQLLHTSVSYGSMKTLNYLKTFEKKFLGPCDRKALAIGFYRFNSSIGLSWITNHLVPEFNPLITTPSQKTEYLLSKESYLGLFWIFECDFEILDEVERLTMGQILFDSLQRGLWFWVEELSIRDNHCLFFSNLSKVYPHMSCYIFGTFCPKVIMKALPIMKNFQLSAFGYAMRNCRSCGCSHLVDSIVHAIRNDDVEFLIAASFYLESEKISNAGKEMVIIELFRYSSNPLTMIQIIADGSGTGYLQNGKWLDYFIWHWFRKKLYPARVSLSRLQKFRLTCIARAHLLRHNPYALN